VPPMLLSRRISVQPFGARIRALDGSRTVTPASITSPGSTPPGFMMLMEDDFPAFDELRLLLE
jgi:hypothetical protein